MHAQLNSSTPGLVSGALSAPTALKALTALTALTALIAHAQSDFSYPPKTNIQPGTVINQSNVDTFVELVDPAVYSVIAAGEVSITTGPYIAFPQHPNYVGATEQYKGQTQLGPETGDLMNYQNGRPFPEWPDISDPRAGEKVAWNMRYTYGPDESETQSLSWHYKSMKNDTTERTIEMYGALMRFSHRHSRAPMPELEQNPANLYSALYLQVQRPQDIRNTQLLTYTKKNDGDAEQAWIYLTAQRRVKRLPTGQKTDAFLGSDIMIEDFMGYNGRIRDMRWEYLGSKELLAPMYAFNALPASYKEKKDDELTVIKFEGKGGCFPSVTWQVRTVHMLKATPVNPSHPLKERIFSIDAETYVPLLTRIYDRPGNLWKLGMVAASDSSQHEAKNEDWQGLVTDGVSMVDLQARHCTTLQFRTHMPAEDLRPNMFTTQQMRAAGR
jgi:hypothetical protein